MKTTKKGEVLVKAGVRLPVEMMEQIKEFAVKNRRSLNDEIIVLLEIALRESAGDLDEGKDKGK